MTPAQQTVHILRKDIRAHWSELLTLALLNLVLVFVSSENWSSGVQNSYDPAMTVSGGMPVLTSILLAAAWCLLILRVVHGESPASRYQYWLTRPYSRLALLSAKGLFILLFVHVMTVVTQIAILELSGVAWRVRDLWLNHIVIFITITLPAMTIAALTRSQSRFLMVALPMTGIALASLVATGFLGDAYSTSSFDSSLGPSAASSIPVRNFLWALVSLPALALIAAFGIVFQYLKRQTRTAVTCCAAGVAASAIMIAALPDALASWTQSKLIGTPADRQIIRIGPPVEGRTTPGTVRELDDYDGFRIAVPIDWSYDETRGLVLVGLEGEIRSTSGLEYRSRAGNGERIGTGFTGSGTPESVRSLLMVDVPRDVFEAISDDEVSIRFSFDLKEYAYYPANPIPRDRSVLIDDVEQCGIGPYDYILCRRGFFGPEGPDTQKQDRESVAERPEGALIITRQAAAIPFAIDPIARTGRYRLRAGNGPVPVLIRAPRSYAPNSLEIENARLSDWLIDSEED